MRLKTFLPAASLLMSAAWSASAWSASTWSVDPGGHGIKIVAAFNDAGPVTKLIVLGLTACGLAAATLAPRLARQAGGAATPHGIGFISGLRLGGPLIALTAVFYNLQAWAVNSAWFNRPPSNLQLAQGYAELALICLAGSFSAALAIFSLEHVRAAIARAHG